MIQLDSYRVALDSSDAIAAWEDGGGGGGGGQSKSESPRWFSLFANNHGVGGASAGHARV